ncbi:MAG: cytochrome c oxidase subunit II [Pseudomonadota bacterium]|nr:cytochrome c oxidase subunit II [Pseudomonadota bacterium]
MPPAGYLRNFSQSVLDPQGPVAAAIAEIAWVLFAGGAVIFVLVMALTAWALFAPPPRRAWLARRGFVVAGGIIFPVLVLATLLVYTFLFRDGVHVGEGALKIEVVGHQWWWRVRYLDAAGRPDFETANEIRIPAGRPVELVLSSADVLHSFWVPNLAGKLDMVPGRVNRLRLAADRPGVFRGQCAEYCGGPHALMALYVVADDTEGFEQWLSQQRKPAAAPNPVFLSRCAACHTVRGTQARGVLGPDLTHLGSRVSLGAGILPNNRDTLARWIVSSQHIKPGNLMPSTDGLVGDELRDLVAYLEDLK